MSFRNTVRNLALSAVHKGLTASGANSRLQRVQGDYVLLLHNTLGDEGAALLRYVDNNRASFVDFSSPQAQVSETPRRRISLSFDDGFHSNLETARELTQRGLSAVFYVPTNVIGMSKTDSDNFFGRPQAEGVMSWKDIEELRSLGHHVGSHCKRHVPLSTLSVAEAEDQVRGSLRVLRDRLGSVEHFAWPFGSLNHAPVNALVEWCTDEGVTAASGVRGANMPERFAAENYLRRDAVSLTNISRDISVFLGIDSIKRSHQVFEQN